MKQHIYAYLMQKAQSMHSPIGSLLRRVAGIVESAKRRACYDMELNGEAWLIHQLAGLNIGCVFDVGAHDGAWTHLCKQTLPDASLFLFEPLPHLNAKLLARFGKEKKVHVSDFGLSDVGGIEQFFSVSERPTRSSLVRMNNQGDVDSMRVRFETGDEFCRNAHIERIDFLKIDTEGAENRVLAGFEQMLRAEKIHMIQFEYGQVNIETHFLLKDFYGMLVPLGFKIGKLEPNGVRFASYSYDQEDFLGPNYIAIHQSREDVARKVAAPSKYHRDYSQGNDAEFTS
ncbi:FkbM family methyltransferase [Novipirellula artificiosorum]|uniref:2-O-methyltransferase NoeI n=1 Tax=Novipirellula artificiosorum TaxID=2528016 RepID=A0A5C6D077_9BACT|nr:FkbM family methyltransferase [Novipirellula artificiosorum]TWU29151.1 2-O-methyltransferase NoeI [Novipirellula artificiosorum]